MALGEDWFTEVDAGGGSAFSLKVSEKLHEERTPYQTIEVFQTETFGRLMVIDGCAMLSDRDNFIYHEMMSHPALFAHPQPARVVIVGGGDCGTVREVLRHPDVETVVQVEIDERVTRIAEAYFPRLCESNDDPRARFLFDDAIRWMQEAPAGSADVIIVDSTDPVGPAEGLFREPFYRDCRRVLGAEGILVQQSESPLYHADLIAAMHQGMAQAGFAGTVLLNFPQCVYPSGWWSTTLAGKARAPVEFRDAHARSKTFQTLYYSADVHRAAAVAPEFLRGVLRRAGPVEGG
jgi:spermidine synthase